LRARFETADMTEGPDSLRAAGFAFLFKKDCGEISRGVWIRGAIAIAVPLVVAEAGWLVLSPHVTRAVSHIELVDALTIVAYFYLMIFAFVGLLAAICFYNLSAKRFRARGRPASFAGLFLIAALSATVASALHPGSQGADPLWLVDATVAVAAALLVWTIWELGIAPDRERKP
jgi:uncharacterized membrane protein YhaH (DUF805 family)